MAGNFTLAGIIHKPFYYKHGYTATTISVACRSTRNAPYASRKPSIGQIRDEPG